MTAAELVVVHNTRCDKERRIKEWRASKAALIARIEEIDKATASKPKRKRAEKAKDERRGAIGQSVATLLKDGRLSYVDILQMILAAHPKALTTTRSIASVAACMRREGIEVPFRRSVGAN